MIRKLVFDDIPDIMKIGESVFEHTYKNTRDTFQDRIKTFPDGCLGFFEEDILIGFTTSEIWARFNKIEYNSKASQNHGKNGHMLYVSDMAVLSENQSKKIGSKLLKELINLSKNLKLKSIYLGTTKARNFYEKNSFKFLKHIPDEDNGYDLMELKIS